jgi:hypothetical protein
MLDQRASRLPDDPALVRVAFMFAEVNHKTSFFRVDPDVYLRRSGDGGTTPPPVASRYADAR